VEGQLDRERIEGLCEYILLAIRANFERGPTSRERCWEALNALAASAALVIQGADGPGGAAEEFFRQTLAQHLESGAIGLKD
jgi:hypothetical protein